MYPPAPTLSIIVIGYKMAAQLLNTVYTLSTRYQRDISESDYEVIVVENSSDDNIDREAVAALGANIRFFRREESSHTPVYAVNFGFQQCRGELIGLMIDGARMLSPRALATALNCWQQDPEAMVTVPGYHLGQQEQYHHTDPDRAKAEERSLLEATHWREDGYQLFDISTFSGANRRGYLQPIMECNCVFAAAGKFASIGYADERFQLRGGGSINLHMYRALGTQAGCSLYVLPGEGSFHQFHGGVTTSGYDDRQAEIERHRVQLHSLWPGGFHSLRRKPQLFGETGSSAQPFLTFSREMELKREKRLQQQGLPLWPDEPDQL
jgi:glycosyltransferase involved in cell wall biosynthesis